MSDHVDCVVIGAGVVSLAVARVLAVQGRDVLVLEAAPATGTGTNSRLGSEGKARLYGYCEQRGIHYRRCGKLIVATHPNQIKQLHTIKDKAMRNGVTDLVLLPCNEAQAIDPQLTRQAALLSPSTSIIDSRSLMLALQGDIENAGRVIAFNQPTYFKRYRNV